MSDNVVEVTVLLPCLNEATTIGLCVQEALEGLLNGKIQGEILVADNGSTDGSQGIAASLGARVIDVPDRGYGNALIAGINAARGQYIVMGDSDCSYNFLSIPVFLNKLKAGYDLVVGCRLPRYGGSIEPGAMPFLHRYLGNPILSGIGKLFFHSPIDDFHCGLRGFRTEAARGLGLQSPGMEFASEMIVKASGANLRISQVPITLRRDRRNRPPHLRTWRDGWRHLRFLLLYSPRWLFLYPGLIMFLCGLAGLVVLTQGPVIVGGVGFETNTLLVASCLLLLGTQVVGFSVIAKACGMIAGLFPPDPITRRVLRGQPFEYGIVAGSLVSLAGLGQLTFAAVQWWQQGFGALSYAETLRMTIPAVTLITLGFQVIFIGFIVALLRLTLRREDNT